MMDIRSPSSLQCGRPRKDLFQYQVSKAWERPIAISIFRQQTWQELFSLNRDFNLSSQEPGRDSVRSCIRPPRLIEIERRRDAPVSNVVKVWAWILEQEEKGKLRKR